MFNNLPSIAEAHCKHDWWPWRFDESTRLAMGDTIDRTFAVRRKCSECGFVERSLATMSLHDAAQEPSKEK